MNSSFHHVLTFFLENAKAMFVLFCSPHYIKTYLAALLTFVPVVERDLDLNASFDSPAVRFLAGNT